MTKARDIASAIPAPSTVSSAELGFLDGVTSAIQTQMNQKPEVVAGKNAVINGGMDIWQRGTSFTGTTLGAYCADRWGYYRGGAAGGATWTRQAAALTGFQYGLRAQRDSGNTSTQYVGTWQALETVNSYPFAGQTVTFSFYAKCGANYSATSNALAVTVLTGTGTDQASYSFTGSTNAITGTATLTTSYQRFTYTGTLSSSLTQVGFQFIGTPTGTAGVNDWYEITGVQLEVGSVATPFSRTTGTIATELAACQRYYQKSYAQGTAVPTNSQFVGVVSGPGTSTANNGNFGFVKLPVVMRTAPTVTTYSYTSSTTSVISNGAGTDQAASSGVAAGIGDGGFSINNNSGGTITTTNGWLIHYAASSEL